MKRRLFHLSPSQGIALSFAVMIFAGAALLNLPYASRNGQSVGFLNALFTATSANCVTGLVVVDTASHWTPFGKGVILVLIQLGGLGFFSIFTSGLILFHRRVSLRNRMVIQASFNQENMGGMVRLVRDVVRVTLWAEGLGAVLLTLIFVLEGQTLGRAWILGCFHSISAFCNAGFDIIGAQSLAPYRNHWPLNLVIVGLIVAGGLGFPVWSELKNSRRRSGGHRLRFRWTHLSLHSKLALCMTGGLLILGTGLFLLLEWSNPETLGPVPWHEKILAALFQSATLRTCGFYTVPQAGLTDLSKVFSCLFMIIGGSPAGTAGGIKTVTVGVILVAMLSALRGRRDMTAFGRSLPLELLQKALTVTCTLLLVVFGATTILYFSERGIAFEHNALDLFFETSSAAGTVGISTGITPFLSPTGKVVVTLCMFLGRLSPITIVVALNMRLRKQEPLFHYPEERVIVG